MTEKRKRRGRTYQGDSNRSNKNEFINQGGKVSKTEGSHRKSKQYRRPETFGHDVQKSELVTVKAENRQDTPDVFDSDDNFLKQESQQADKSGLDDGYRKKDTYHQSGKKSQYHKNRVKKEKQSDGQKYSEGNEYSHAEYSPKDTTFTNREAAEKSDFIPSEKLEQLEKKAEKAGKKTARAKKKLPQKKEYSFERRFNEETGRAEYVLTAVKKEKPFKHDTIIKKGAGQVKNEGTNFVHGKIAQHEKENSGVEAAHKTEQTGERAVGYVARHRRNKLQKRRAKVVKLEKVQFKADTNFLYQKYLEENPQMRNKFLRKRLQKERIKREYAKAYRKGAMVKNTKETAVKSANTLTAVAKKLQEIVTKNAAIIGTVAIIALLLIIIMTAFSSCGAMFGDTVSMVVSGSYLSEPSAIDAAELVFTEKEMNLQNEVDRIETDYPGYDEYRYNVGEIGHDPIELISYLSALDTEFTFAEVESQLDDIFSEMYTLTTNEVVEIRTRTETHTSTDPETGDTTEDEVEVEYEYYILEVVLQVKPLSVTAATNLNSEQKELYDSYQSTKGNLQQFSSPLDLNWYYYVSSYYGYRKNPATGNQEMHRGLDIAVPEGTVVYAAHTGTVTTAAYDSYYGNYIVITDNKGFTTKYAHLSSISISAGQSVEKETPIGATGNTGGSTGSHLHIEVLHEDIYYNPIFYFAAGEKTLYGGGAGGGGNGVIPPDSYDDETVQRLINEAERYLGMPYTFGGTPPRSFDCSAFVCWVFTNSGVHNLPRTTAQGIYDQCTPVSASDAKAGDIIFFTGTYNAGRPVTHVGIYCGNGVMLHCGNPIQYTSINTSYWQSHFYGYGRLY